MTTLAYKDGILACDSRITIDGKVMGNAVKGGVFGDYLVGVAGDFVTIPAIMDWVKNGIKKAPPKFPKGTEFICLLINRKGAITIYENDFKPMHMDDKVFATGSGSAHAYGAMHVGATAKDAVIAAAAYDGNTGGRVRTFQFEDKP